MPPVFFRLIVQYIRTGYLATNDATKYALRIFGEAQL